MINHNKAYILGLLVGGGRLDKDTFLIELPFSKWGMEPKKMGNIAVDILQRIASLFQNEYSVKVTYEIGNKKWFIKPIEDEGFKNIQSDLLTLNLPTTGFLLNNADLKESKNQLKGVNAENFLSGIFDARLSLSKSHRRFDDKAPVVSLEIPGGTKNFKFVVQLCSWLTEMGSVTDQILYNHPNQHSTLDPTYKNWNKGFKIRFLIKSFLANHSFALQAKSIDAKLIEKNQTKFEQVECLFRKIRQPSPISIHNDMNSNSLPEEVRNKLYFHYFHFCATLGCKFAPTKEVEKIVKNKNKLISFFPLLSRGTLDDIEKQFQLIFDKYYQNEKIVKLNLSVKALLSDNENYNSYHKLKEGLAFLLADELNGKRHKGPMSKIIDRNISTKLEIRKIYETENEPILIINNSNDRAIICSNINSSKNQKLIKERTQTSGLEVKLL